MNFFEKQLRQMFGGNGIITDAKFVGKTMLGKLDDELRVKLQFVTTGTAREYTAIKASIINRKDGVVDQQTFKFSDIIGMKPHRIRGQEAPYMWEYNNKPEWYTPVTIEEKAKIADTVLDYVEMYQEPTMSANEMQFQ